MSMFYTLIRRHLKTIAICALLLIVVFSYFFPSRWLEMTDAVVLLCTLLIVFAYTDVTHEMLRATQQMLQQQNRQFEQVNRPWLYIDDLVYEQHPGGDKLVLLVVNSGKIPAQYEVETPKIAITPLFGEKPIFLTIQDNPPRISEVVFPYVQGKETRYMIPLEIPESAIEYLSAHCAVEIILRLKYRMVNAGDGWPYEFAGIISVPNFDLKSKVQNTYIGSMKAS
mgnify:CR=1 FL=1